MLSAYKNTAYVLLGGALCKAWQLIFSCFSLCALVKRCLPCAIVASGLIIIYCVFLLYGVYDVLTSEVSNGDKVFFAIFIGCIVAVYVFIMVLMWKNRFKGRKQ